MAVAALVLGIIGTLFSLNWLTVWVGGPAAIVAIVLGIMARKQNVAAGRPTGMATAGLILGIVGTTIAMLIFAVCASCAAAVGAAGREASKQIEKAAQEAKVQQAAEADTAAKGAAEAPAAVQPPPAEGAPVAPAAHVPPSTTHGGAHHARPVAK